MSLREQSIVDKSTGKDLEITAANEAKVLETNSNDIKTAAEATAAIVALSATEATLEEVKTATEATATSAALSATEATLLTIKTAAETLAATVTALRQQVDIVSALPAGSNALGSVSLNTLDKEATAQNPLPTDGDSVYEKDIWAAQSTSVGFSGEVIDLVNNLHSVMTNVTATDPKEILIHFNRTTVISSLSIGAFSGDFSNVKIIIVTSGGTEITIQDDTADSTKYTSKSYELPIVGFNSIKVQFHTADTVSLSNVFMPRVVASVARIQGRKPDGTFTTIGATRNDNLKVSVQEYGDTPSIDAFARLRTSEPFTLFDSKQLHDKQPLFWDEEIGGAATSVHSEVNAETRMNVTTSAADYVIRQTKQRFNYQPGKSQLSFMTFHSPQSTGMTSKVGLFDGTGANNLTPNNGIYFEADGAVSWNISKDGATAETATMDNWNVDKLDGTGASGITLDLSQAQILIIDFEWLGVGRVRVGFVIDGLIYYVHYFNHANKAGFDTVYMSSPNLPLRYQIETDGTTASHLSHICSTVISEGGVEKTGILRSVDNGKTDVVATLVDTLYPLLAIRLKAAYLDITVTPENFSAMNSDKGDFRWALLLNPTITGTALSYADVDNSSVQSAVGTGAQTITDQGLVIGSGYVSDKTREAGDSLQTALRIGSTIAGVRDELVLAVDSDDPGKTFLGSLGFRELL